MEVLRNIFQVFGGAYANIANIYVVKGDNTLVLIDTAENAAELSVIKENMEYWGLDRYPVSHVLLSHKHFNHIGNAHVWRDEGAKIVAGEEDAQAIEKGIMNDIIDFPPFPPRRYTPCPVDLKVEDGDVIEAAGLQFTAIHVPGHTAGSMMYLLQMDSKTILFPGDVIGVGSDCAKAELTWAGGIDYDQKVYFEKTILGKFMTLGCDAILPGHGQLCLQNGTELLRDACRAALLGWRQPAISYE